jgi:tetratricopeptide (TPR) repeat protein
MKIFAVRLTLAAAVVTAPLLATQPSAAAPNAEDPTARVAQRKAEVLQARGVEAYTALRNLWQEWDKGDPASVHVALTELSQSRALATPVRTYAGLLEAYAERRRGDLAGSARHVRRLGFIEEWLVAGPFDNEGKGGFARTFGPEDEGNKPIDPTHPYAGKERPVRFRAAAGAATSGWLDFGSLLRPQENVCGYAVTFVQSKRGKARSASIWAGSGGALRVYLNGREVLRDDKYRGLDADRMGAKVQLEAGPNRLLIKACGVEAAPIVSIRMADAEGAPDADLEARADYTVSQSDAGTKGPAPQPSAKPPTMLGPVPTFDARAQSGDAATLEAYARYLVMTAGDDPADHRARDLARMAAEKTPTIDRLLLAGDLAESRNQREPWIAKAEALKPSGPNAKDETIRVLLARAAHARGGANWRDCIPFYERVLAQDPDNVPALLARVELYGEAGLKETAVRLLERAVERRPRSVSLLRSLATELRDTGRTLEAEEAMNRYALYRFDDPSYIRSKLELALSRRDDAAARRWVTRFVELIPDEVSTMATAARTHLALGDRATAIGYYKRALDLAPEDTDTLRALADVYGLSGQRDEQEKYLRRIVEIKPQDKDVREYLAHIQPPKPRDDEAFARPSAEFLKDRSASAAGQARRTLVDLQVSTVFPNGLSSRFHQVVYQPLTEAAAKDGKQYAFGFEGDSEIVQLRGARVYRVNGQVEEAVASGDAPADDPNMVMYTSARVFYVQFPRLFPGDIVELQYRVEDIAERNAFADYFGEVNYMQSTEPVKRAEYVVIAPKSRQLVFNEPRIPGLKRSQEERGDKRVFKFVAEDVPPIQKEPDQAPMSELLGYVHVSTYRSWDEMGKWYWGLVKDQFTADDEVRKRVQEITKGLKDDRAKVRAVYSYVVQKTRYVALEFGIHGFKPYRCAQIFARGFGDCKDKATLIVTMLKELGIPATIVIVRTGMRGDFDGSAPASLAPFDHAIAYVPSMDLYLDGTAENTGSMELPAMDRGALALQINEGKPKLVHLPDPPASESVTTRKIEATVASDGSAQLSVQVDVSGVHASGYRQRYQSESTRKTRVTEDLFGQFFGAEVSKVDANDLSNVEESPQIKAKAKVREFSRKDGATQSLSVSPTDSLVKSYASLSTRKSAVRISAQATSVSEWLIHLPAGARVKSLPTATTKSSPYGSFTVQSEVTGDTVKVRTSIAMTKTRIPLEEYAAFRAFCEEADRALGQRLLYTK